MVPLPSWPRMIGGGIGTPPVATVTSEWHTPLASIWTRTSLEPRLGRVSSSMTRGSLYAFRTAAFMADILSESPARRSARVIGPRGADHAPQTDSGAED